jgi:NAD-dependent deacetylase sirtuin 4
MRLPYTGVLTPPLIIPRSATIVHGAANAFAQFLHTPPTKHSLQNVNLEHASSHTVLPTGAGISVASELADYRGANGTYTQNKSYRPTYSSHEAQKR